MKEGIAYLVAIEGGWTTVDSSGPIRSDTCDGALKFADEESAEVFAKAVRASTRWHHAKVEEHSWSD